MSYHLSKNLFILRKEVRFMFEVMADMHSLLYPLMKEYMHEREVKGLYLYKAATMLKSLELYSVSVGYDKDYVTKEHYLNWVESLEFTEKSKITYRRYFMEFSAFLSSLGHESYVGMVPGIKSDFTPYIYNDSEISLLFKTADSWIDPEFKPNSCTIVMPALLRLLYSTAMRLGEALNITNSDIDFNRKVVRLRETKNRHERFCALNPSVESVLNIYIHYRNKLPVKNVTEPDSFLFCCKDGSQVKQGAVRYKFHQFQKVIGMRHAPNGFLPRIHDLRHTACVNAMRKLMASGKDIYCCMPQISAFMGHKDTLSTEKYLRLTSSAFPELLSMVANVTMPIAEVINRNLKKMKDETGKL